jgi:hypothetical protein
LARLLLELLKEVLHAIGRVFRVMARGFSSGSGCSQAPGSQGYGWFLIYSLSLVERLRGLFFDSGTRRFSLCILHRFAHFTVSSLGGGELGNALKELFHLVSQGGEVAEAFTHSKRTLSGLHRVETTAALTWRLVELLGQGQPDILQT